MVKMDAKKLAEDLMDELNYYMDGYYLSGNGYKEVTKIVENIIIKHIENKE